MKHTYRPPIVFLTGGLGNQLFQVANAIHEYDSNPIELDWRIGRPRLNRKGLPEISELNLGPNFSFDSPSNWRVRLINPSVPLRLIANLYLRNSIKSTLNFRSALIKQFCCLSWPVAGLLYKHQFLILERSRFTIVNAFARKCFVGYFQNPIWLDNQKVVSVLKNAHVDFDGLSEYQLLAKNENPLIVHLRKSDYRLDKNIGMIKGSYFVSILKSKFDKSLFGKIWIFSDEPTVAFEELQEFSNDVRVIESGLSSSQTLEVMRLGSGYVISNSTFSWWGAFLSDANATNITAPFPWFKAQETPEHLIPGAWQKADPWR